MTNVTPVVVLPHRKGQRSEKRSRPPWCLNPTMTTSWRFEVLIFSQLSVRAPEYYASQFEAAELNGVFYRTPTPDAVKSRKGQTVPDD